MKHWLVSATLGAFVLVHSSALAAEEMPHLEFVQGLKAKNYHDLALEYLEKLSKAPTISKDLAAILPLEIARLQVEMASRETKAERREEMYAKARKQYEAFLKDNANRPQAAIAQLDLVRLDISKVRTQFDKARRVEGDPAQKDLDAARADFEKIGARLQAIVDQIDQQQARAKNPLLDPTKIDAELERAINLFDQWLTYKGELSEEAEAKKEGIKTKTAEALKKVADDNAKNRTGWLARAWLVRYQDEVADSFEDAKSEYDKIKDVKGTHVEDGKRLARYYYIRALDRQGQSEDLVKAAKEWLLAYPLYVNTSEGYGVRIRLANAYIRQAKAAKEQKAEKAANKLYGEAAKLLEELEKSENIYRDEAAKLKVQVTFTRDEKTIMGDVDKLQTFQQCYLRAQAEIAEMNKKKDDEDAKQYGERRKKHCNYLIAALTRGMKLADEKTPEKERIEAGTLLVRVLLTTNNADDLQEAASQGEALARKHPASSQAGMAGVYAMLAYAQSIDMEENKIEEGKGGDPERIKANRERLTNLAKHVEAAWKDEPAVADAARHQLGQMALKQHQYDKAVEALARITPKYHLYVQTQFYLGAAALEAQKEKLNPPKGRPSWQEQAVAAFKKIPEPKGMDPEENRLFFIAKIQLANLYFTAKQYEEMEKLIPQINARFEKVKETNFPGMKEIAATLESLPLYVAYGKADKIYSSEQADRYAQARALLDPLVDQKNFSQYPPEIQRVLLVLTLKANAFDGKTARALELLKKLQANAGNLQNQGLILAGLVQQFKQELKALEKKNPKEYNLLMVRLSAFLDELAKQPLDKMPPDIIRFLAFFYSALDRHDQASALLKKIPKPPAEAKPEEVRFYNTVQLMRIQESRLARNLDEADAILKAVKETDFGKKSVEVRMEENKLLEAHQKFGLAAKGWNQLIEELKKAKQNAPALEPTYQECWFRYISCMYNFGMNATDPKKKETYIQRAARLIVNAEAGDPPWGGLKDRYEELLKSEPLLKEKYLEIKKEQSEEKAEKKEPNNDAK